jgi:hypothetical protein
MGLRRTSAGSATAVAAITATYHRRMGLDAWIEAYGQAWETGDEDLMVSLFTDDGATARARSASRSAATTRSEPTGVATLARSATSMSGWAARSSTATASQSSGGRRWSMKANP